MCEVIVTWLLVTVLALDTYMAGEASWEGGVYLSEAPGLASIFVLANGICTWIGSFVFDLILRVSHYNILYIKFYL